MPRRHGPSITNLKATASFSGLIQCSLMELRLPTGPGAPRLIYRQQFCPWPAPLDTRPGDTVTVKVSLDW